MPSNELTIGVGVLGALRCGGGYVHQTRFYTKLEVSEFGALVANAGDPDDVSSIFSGWLHATRYRPAPTMPIKAEATTKLEMDAVGRLLVDIRLMINPDLVITGAVSLVKDTDGRWSDPAGPNAKWCSQELLDAADTYPHTGIMAAIIGAAREAIDLAE